MRSRSAVLYVLIQWLSHYLHIYIVFRPVFGSTCFRTSWWFQINYVCTKGTIYFEVVFKDLAVSSVKPTVSAKYVSDVRSEGLIRTDPSLMTQCCDMTCMQVEAGLGDCSVSESMVCG